MYFIRQAEVQNMNEMWKVALKCFAPIHKIQVTSQMESASDVVVLVGVVPPR